MKKILFEIPNLTELFWLRLGSVGVCIGICISAIYSLLKPIEYKWDVGIYFVAIIFAMTTGCVALRHFYLASITHEFVDYAVSDEPIDKKKVLVNIEKAMDTAISNNKIITIAISMRDK